MSWDEAIKTEESMQGGGMFLRVESGQKVEVTFLGEPATVIKCFDKRTNKPVKPGDIDAEDMRQTTRFLMNVAVMPGMDLKIFDCGVSLFRDIRTYYEKGRLPKYTFEISKTGQNLETKWKLLQENELKPEQLKALAALELHPLGESGTPF